MTVRISLHLYQYWILSFWKFYQADRQKKSLIFLSWSYIPLGFLLEMVEHPDICLLTICIFPHLIIIANIRVRHWKVHHLIWLSQQPYQRYSICFPPPLLQMRKLFPRGYEICPRSHNWQGDRVRIFTSLNVRLLGLNTTQTTSSVPRNIFKSFPPALFPPFSWSLNNLDKHKYWMGPFAEDTMVDIIGWSKEELLPPNLTGEPKYILCKEYIYQVF